MTYSAVDDVGEAYEATRALLVPVDPRRWLVLAVVVFFVSGASGFDLHGNHWFADVPTPPLPGPGVPGAGPGPLPDVAVATLVLVVAAAVAVALAVGVVAAVMEFAFVRILERRDARVRAYLRPNVRKGLSLFALRLLLGLAVVATFTLLFVLVASGGVAFLAVVLLLSPVLVVGLVGVYAFHRFTVDFVVPVMLVDDVGVLAGWRRFLPEIRSELPQYGVYALVRFAIGILAAIVTAIGFTMVAIVVGIPFAVVALAFYAVGALLNAGAAVTTLLWGVAALYALAVTVAGVTLVQVPVSTYLRYYSLLVLADVSPDYDLVSDVRAHLRDGAPPTGGGGAGSGGAGGPGDPGGAGGPGGTGGAGGIGATTAEEADATETSEDVTETGPGPGDDASGDPAKGYPDTAEPEDGDAETDDSETDETSTDDSETDDSEMDDSETDDSDTGESATDDSETDDKGTDEAASNDPETDDPETDDGRSVDSEAYRTETEEPERYGTDEDDGR